MNKIEFLQKLMRTYPKSFWGQETRTAQEVINDYKRVLLENCDFSRLYKIMLEEHEGVMYAPSVAWLFQKQKAIKPPERYNPPGYNPEPIPEHCKVLIEEMRLKYKKRQNDLKSRSCHSNLEKFKPL